MCGQWFGQLRDKEPHKTTRGQFSRQALHSLVKIQISQNLNSIQYNLLLIYSPPAQIKQNLAECISSQLFPKLSAEQKLDIQVKCSYYII